MAEQLKPLILVKILSHLYLRYGHDLSHFIFKSLININFVCVYVKSEYEKGMTQTHTNSLHCK